MKLRLPLLVLLAALGTSAHAATMHGVSTIDKVTYTLEDLDESDGITPSATEFDWSAPFAEFMVAGSSGSAFEEMFLSESKNFLRVGTSPPYNFLYGLFGGDSTGSLNLFSNFSAGTTNYGKMLNSRSFWVSPNTRIRFKTKFILHGGVANEGPAMSDTAQLTLKANLITYKSSTPWQNMLYSKVLTQELGSVFLHKDVEMEVLNDSNNVTAISIYYEVVNYGVNDE